MRIKCDLSNLCFPIKDMFTEYKENFLISFKLEKTRKFSSSALFIHDSFLGFFVLYNERGGFEFILAACLFNIELFLIKFINLKLLNAN